ncbi:MAG: Unknown protein [uncultured Sulfurovum sp.]|uniref:Mut7-C RNAse domain-containing protein n=1 Tax=uncultured Sulfurovum sp. TaxID=269237 RepID=A0A6S6TL08_9BACT|nr:MAG: Unknown protein [uncultured Sulfurovum sp.]
MPFYLSPQTLKKQTKILVKNWKHSSITTAKSRTLLCQLYGYGNSHEYQKFQKEKGLNFSTINKASFSLYYKTFIQKLSALADINETQAQKIIHLLWSDYLKDNLDISTKLYTASFYFYGACLDFVDAEVFKYDFNDNPSVKDAIEAIGVPHVEVGHILVNGQAKGFDRRLKENDKVEVYGQSISSTLPFKPQKISFLLDVHLGTLARYLRMAGFDALYESKDYGDAFLAEVASSDEHIMLSRDIGLLKRGKLDYGHWVRHTDPKEQFKEIVKLYGLEESFKPMSRCISCNEAINAVEKTAIESLVPSKVYAWKEDFFQCSSCAKVYWEGSHYENMMMFLDEVSL